MVEPEDTPTPLSMDGMGHAQARYGVKRTSLASLAPVTLTISQGVWNFQDYLTCEEAELLAGTLRARARQVREERARAREQVMSDLEVLSRAARTPYTHWAAPADTPEAA
jgi:hypothetical protein